MTDTLPLHIDPSIRSYGKYYTVDTRGQHARWNRDAFQMLYLLFQMTVTDLPRTNIPGITIAK